MKGLLLHEVESKDGRFVKVEGTDRELQADLVFLAMGFVGPEKGSWLDQLGLALDERGKSLTSEAFAKTLARWRDEGTADVAFVIGGADGLADTLRKRARLLLSLGAMTWPHMLVRGLLAEQLYRAERIWAGHPYHRA